MGVLVVSASMRANSQSLKVANWLKNHIASLGSSAELLDLHEFKLPMFDDGETVADNKEELLRKINEASAFVFVSPEWDGMMSYGLINMMLYIKDEMAHKPVMLVGVSSGRGGSYPLAQMKQLGQKNRHFIISPENLVVGGVKEMLNDQEMDESSVDYPIKVRADYSLKILIEYGKALEKVRSSGVVDMTVVPNGV